MSANVPATRPPQKAEIAAGGQVAALIPQNLEQAFRLSQALAASGMAPRGIDKPEQIMVAIMAGAELGLAPFQSLQSFAVVNGRPSLWGDGLLAVVRGRGVKVKEWFDNDDEPTKAFCHVTRPDTGEEVERTFSLADAKKANLIGKTGPWQTNQKRMLQMRARAFALRDGCADILRGIQVREEVEDYQDARIVHAPRASGLRDRLSGPSGEGFTSANAPEEPVDFVEQAEEIAHDAEVSDVDEGPDPQPDVNDAWDHMAWSAAMREAADTLTTPEDVQAWFTEVAASAEYQQLIAADEAEALALKAHAIRRKKELAQ
jgi:hypothetical protein